MDLSDIRRPKPYGHVQYEFDAFGTIPFHTCLPITADGAHPRLQNIVVASHEALEADCRENYHTPYVVDVEDPRNPKVSVYSRAPRPRRTLLTTTSVLLAAALVPTTPIAGCSPVLRSPTSSR